MDFSSLLSKEINKKRKANDAVRLYKRGKKNNQLEKNASDNLVPTDAPSNSTQETSGEHLESSIEPADREKDEEAELLKSISDEQLREKLLEFNESDSEADKLTLIKKLQILTKNQNRLKKYKDQIDLESKLNESPDNKTITMESILHSQKFQHELYVQLRVLIKELVKEWEEDASRKQEPDLLLQETKIDIVKLLYKLRVRKLTGDMITSLATIMYYIQHNDYRKANESYMKLSIGNVAWPIGVRDVGIHARSADSKIAKANANIMIDDKTRRWITAVKRLLTYKERKWDDARGL